MASRMLKPQEGHNHVGTLQEGRRERDPQTLPSPHLQLLCQASHGLNSAGSQSPRSSLAPMQPPQGLGQGRGDGPGEAKRLRPASRIGTLGASLSQGLG